MKILFDHHLPFSLAHGGAQVQIEQTRAALAAAGVEVEYLRWWDAGQKGDLIHFFGKPSAFRTDLAHQKGIKVVVTHLLGAQGVRSALKQFLHKMAVRTSRHVLPRVLSSGLGWDSWQSADAYIAITPWEKKLMVEIFEAPEPRVHVVPNGVSDFFFHAPPVTRGPWLITTASILPVKRLVETAQAAVLAKTPYWVIGRPFSETDPYYREFAGLCQQNPQILRYDKTPRTQQELAVFYREARGFVLLSRWETQSLSALEAAASGCPLLLADLPWARATFGNAVRFCPVTPASEVTAKALREFYDAAPTLSPPARPATWNDVAAQLKTIYERVLASSR